MWVWILLIIVLIIIYIKIKRSLYYIKIDNTLMFSGAPGTGKTNEMVRMALKLWKGSKRRIKFRNWFRRRFRKEEYEIPVLYSNIPIRIGKYKNKEFKLLKEHLRKDLKFTELELKKLSRSKFCQEVELGHILLNTRQSEKAVTVMTEIGKIASQYEWNNLNVQENVDEWISMYRQYTFGGYFLCDDQSSDNVAVNIRRRLGTVINMIHFNSFWKLYWTKMRNLTISEDIKTIEKESTEDNMRTRIGFFPLFHKNYDTYAFSERYTSVPQSTDTKTWISYKTNTIMQLPKAYRDRQGVIHGINIPTKTLDS